MNRRTAIVGIALASVAVFAGGAWLYEPAGDGPSATPASATDGAPLVRPHAPTFGPAGAPVTIVEFFDPACEACRAFHPIVKQIMAIYPDKVRLVLRYTAFHPTSNEAIRILEAARRQDKFSQVLERLFETQSRWAPHGRGADSAWTVLNGTGLDIEKARADAKASDIAKVMDLDAADVTAMGVSKTPTFFVNGKPLQRFGAQQLFDLVKAEIAAN